MRTTSLINQAIDRYHALLGPNATPAFWSDFQQRLRDAKIMFGDRVSVDYMRAQFLSPEQEHLVKHACKTLWGALDTLVAACTERPELIDWLGLTPEERMLIAVDPGYPGASTMARFDSFLSGTDLHFVELNAECPAGPAYTEVMGEVFLSTPFMQEFSREYTVRTFSTRDRLHRQLLETWSAWKGKHRELPRIAIVDWSDVPTYHEFELVRDFLIGKGLEVTIADPCELRYENGVLWSGDFRIDMVYRRVLTNEFLEQFDRVQPMWEAYRDGAVCVVNNFRAKLLHKKMIFGLLTDGSLQDLFSAEERETIRRHVPWTRKVTAGATDHYGEPIDLVAFMRSNRDRLVLKPNDDYGGKGITVGWTVDQAEWERAIDGALDNDFVVQEKVSVSSSDFPTVREGLAFDHMNVDLDPFVWQGEVEGFLTRLSGTALCNVTSGGGIVPTFVIEPRAN